MNDDPEVRLGWKFLSLNDRRFLPAVRVHDHAYREGSGAQRSGLTRAECDEIFLEMCLRLAVDADPVRAFAARRRAYFYYRVVRMFGAFLWEGK